MVEKIVSQPDEMIRSLQNRITVLEQENASLRAELQRSQTSEARYRQVVENSPISIAFVASDGRPTEGNRAFEQMFGWTVEQLVEQDYNILTDPQLIENGTLKYMQQALVGETVVEPPTYYDASKTVETGQLLRGQGHYFPIWSETGEVQEFVEICADVTALYEAQQTLLQEQKRAAQERAQLLSTIAQVANLLLRSQDYTTVLPDVVRLLGEAVGSDRCIITHNLIEDSGKVAVKFLQSWFRKEELVIGMIGSDPDSALLIEENWQEFHQQFVRGETANFIVAALSEPMRSFFEAHHATSMLLVPIFVEGQLWGQIGFDNCGEPRLYDEAEISIVKIAADSIAAAIERQAKDEELRKSEALYRSLFEISNEGIYRWELEQPIPLNLPLQEQVDRVYVNYRVTQANDAYLNMMGLTQHEEIATIRMTDVHVEDSEKNQAFMLACCENSWRARNAESEEIDVNGRRCYFLNSVISFIEDDRVTGGWGTQIDITELREAQQALLQAEQARTHLLTTITTIANQLLRSPDYTIVLPHVLQILGEAAGADRCSLVQNINHPESGKPAVRLHTEWCRAGIQASIVHTPDLESALLWEDFPDAQDKLGRGEIISFLVDAELPEPARQLLSDQGNLSMVMVPIVVQDQFWGVFGFDYCQKLRSYDEADYAIFAIAADSVAAAIERQQTDSALRASEEALIEARVRTEAAILEERNRMAREIHDTIAQGLTGIIMQLQAAEKQTQPEQRQARIEAARQLAKTGLLEARRSVWALRPQVLEDNTLPLAIAHMVAQLTVNQDITVQCAIEETAYPLSPIVEEHLLRLSQEALTNVVKHAQATHCWLQLAFEPTQIRLRVQDNGKGFQTDLPASGFGLTSMQQRADRINAALTITSQPGVGTTVIAIVPRTPTPVG